MKTLKENKGWTLVEISVAMVLTAIIMAFLAGILFTSGNVFATGASANEAKLMGDTVYNWVSEKLIYASHLQILQGGTAESEWSYDEAIRIDSASQRLYYKNGEEAEYNFYGDEFYHGTTVEIKVQAHSGYLVDLTVTVKQNGEERYHTGSTVEVLNIRLAGLQIEGVMDTELINPTLVFDSAEIIASDS